MALELIVTHNNESCDIGEFCVGSVKLCYYKSGEPSSLEFSVARDLSEKFFGFYEGDSVGLIADGTKMFYGYIFTKSRTKEQIITVKAYDQLRYLKNKDTYIYYGQTASSLLRLIIDDYRLEAGEIEESGYVLPERIESNQSLFDIILTAVSLTKKAAGKEFILYDDYGRLCFKNKENMELPLLAKEEMDGLIDFTYVTSIDSGTYNRVKLFLSREESSCFSAEDSETIDEWGILQYTEVLTRENLLSGAASAEMAQSILAEKNRRTQSLVIEDVGDTTVRAGSRIWVCLSGEGEIAKTAYVERTVHTFENGLHRMKLNIDLEG
ncbi:MAG: hydrolase [Clostridiales bacterium]|nr:hydrolase [Clostridiales bacterium]